jgi:hypothetical protein
VDNPLPIFTLVENRIAGRTFSLLFAAGIVFFWPLAALQFVVYGLIERPLLVRSDIHDRGLEVQDFALKNRHLNVRFTPASRH